jgi:FXSXX-COOH protein
MILPLPGSRRGTVRRACTHAGREGTHVLMDTSEPEYTSVLVDVADVPMDALDELPATALTAVLRDVIDPEGETVAAFSSSLS